MPGNVYCPLWPLFRLIINCKYFALGVSFEKTQRKQFADVATAWHGPVGVIYPYIHLVNIFVNQDNIIWIIQPLEVYEDILLIILNFLGLLNHALWTSVLSGLADSMVPLGEPRMARCWEMSTLPAGHIPQCKVTSMSSNGSLGFIVCCRMVVSVSRW